jgi:cell division protein FtsL
MQKKINIYEVKKGARKAAHGITASLMIFFVLMILSISFILYQLKEFQINKDIKEIRKVRNEIEELRSLNQYYRGKVNELTSSSRIRRLANEMGLQESLTAPRALIVDKGELNNYEEKDKEVSQ